jgi:hypothetical protein
MSIPDKQIKRAMHLLTQWNPLGDRASAIHDLDNYKVEATDILFHVGLSASGTNPTPIVRDVLNEAFDLFLSIADCTAVGEEIKKILT